MNRRPASATGCYPSTREPRLALNSKQQKQRASAASTQDQPREHTDCMMNKPHQHHLRHHTSTDRLQYPNLNNIKQQANTPRSSSANRISGTESKARISSDERPRWVGAWSSLSTTTRTSTNNPRQTTQRRQPSPAVVNPSGSISTAQNSRDCRNRVENKPSLPSPRAHHTHAKGSPEGNLKKVRGRPDLTADTVRKPSVQERRGSLDQLLKRVESCSQDSDSSSCSSCQCRRQGRQPLKRAQKDIPTPIKTKLGPKEEKTSSALGDPYIFGGLESRRSSATYSSFSFSSLHSSPTLIRRYLDKDTDAASIRTSMTSMTSVTIDSASDISLQTSTATVTPLTAVATITGRLEGTRLDDLSCIDNDALSTSSTSVDDEALDPKAMNGALKSRQDQTHPNTSPAQEACSKIIEQNNERHRRSLVEVLPRFFTLGGHSSSHLSVTNKSTITTITTTATTTATTATTIPITAADPKYQQQICVSSIESFPTHDIPDSKFQQLWDLFKFSRSTPMDYTPKQIMTTKDEPCH